MDARVISCNPTPVPEPKKDGSREWYIQLPLVVDSRFSVASSAWDKDGKFSHHDVVNDMLKISADIENSLDESPSDARNR